MTIQPDLEASVESSVLNERIYDFLTTYKTPPGKRLWYGGVSELGIAGQGGRPG